MELGELNADERLALVGLVKTVVLSDGRVSDDEVDELDDIVEAFGEIGYRRALDDVEKRFHDEEGFRKFLETIVRQDARELIYGTVLAGAAADAIEGGESELLAWLGETWNIELHIQDPEA